ncbi:PREDICTED: rho guanine nucleotide exchange factor 4-like isoform X1 [Drosophila arizonae]|uniref:Rho guanine nucleotide exchange factor 4-like isoform X1 n=2 Tax=Drosophila arizonae TaxID=7263 RepID=A0ABM1NKU2_DROAR|nr:PREDICTED: rho guanine nucleotide exchange factor 4-like isoform X1 [Drosophila arizonae]
MSEGPADDCNLAATQAPLFLGESKSNSVNTNDSTMGNSSNKTHSAQPEDNEFNALRQAAIRELLETEINYVKVLSVICDGFLPAMRSHTNIFPRDSIDIIFSNITSIYRFHQVFLEALRKGVEQNQIAKVFLSMHKGFLCYSTYCNAYTRAVAELASYRDDKDARILLESCCLGQLPLSAHLLAPVQRICRYPLHLKKLMIDSSTNETGAESNQLNYEHVDLIQHNVPDTHATVNMALQKMRVVIEAVNEGRRHSEIIAGYQDSLQNFKGLPLHLFSTRFFLQADAKRLKHNLWNCRYILIIFDRQLVYCKRDFIKRRNFVYKGRLLLDCCTIVNMRDGAKFGLHTVKNAIRIYCRSRNKWYDFSFATTLRKYIFLNSLALERTFCGLTLNVSEIKRIEFKDEQQVNEYCDLFECNATHFPNQSTHHVDIRSKRTERNDDIPSTSSGTGKGILEKSVKLLHRLPFIRWFRKPSDSNCDAAVANVPPKQIQPTRNSNITLAEAETDISYA